MRRPHKEVVGLQERTDFNDIPRLSIIIIIKNVYLFQRSSTEQLSPSVSPPVYLLSLMAIRSTWCWRSATGEKKRFFSQYASVSRNKTIRLGTEIPFIAETTTPIFRVSLSVEATS